MTPTSLGPIGFRVDFSFPADRAHMKSPDFGLI
jgi:hypothetical protein